MRKTKIAVKILCILFVISFLCIYWEGNKFGAPNVFLILFTSFYPPFVGLISIATISILLYVTMKKDWKMKNLWIALTAVAILVFRIFFYSQDVIVSMGRSTLSKLTFILFGTLSILFLFSLIFTYFKFRKEFRNQV